MVPVIRDASTPLVPIFAPASITIDSILTNELAKQKEVTLKRFENFIE